MVEILILQKKTKTTKQNIQILLQKAQTIFEKQAKIYKERERERKQAVKNKYQKKANKIFPTCTACTLKTKKGTLLRVHVLFSNIRVTARMHERG